jgi:hypothetical protein
MRGSIAKSVLVFAIGTPVAMPVTAPAAAPVTPEYFAVESVKIGKLSQVSGNLGVDRLGGKLSLGRDSTMADFTTVIGDRVRLDEGTSVYHVFAVDLDADEAEIRGVTGTATLPIRDPLCEPVTIAPCGGPDIVIAGGEVAAPLPPGTYGKLKLNRAAVLPLMAGAYSFCSIRLATDAELRFEYGDAGRLDVSGNIRVGKTARIARDTNAPVPLLAGNGRSIRFGKESLVEAEVVAEASKVTVSTDAYFAGSICAGKLTTRTAVVLNATPAGVCGDGVDNQPGEECDGSTPAEPGALPADAACPGACLSNCLCPAPPGPWRFTEVAAAAGVDILHAYDESLYLALELEYAFISGGAAAGDFDNDGWTDLLVVSGPDGGNRLLRNKGDGTFEDLSASSGVRQIGSFTAGPTFADYDGDGYLDLLIGGIHGTTTRLFKNSGSSTFADVTPASGISMDYITYGSAFGDYDGDNDLDFFAAHWNRLFADGTARLWRNDLGSGTFTDVTATTGVHGTGGPIPVDFNFSPNFTDFDNDGDQDLLVAGDFGTSRVYRNDGPGTFFTDTTTAVISEENGMGAAVGDYDNDGDVDWFVSAIWDPNGEAEGAWGVSGNRLYRNLGNGTFEDVTDTAGVRRGYWGWASCFADFDLDGHLDIFHTNGFRTLFSVADEYHEDPARLFLSNGDGTFTERSSELELIDTEQGRAAVCFDYDRDGDIDVFIGNNQGRATLWRNDEANLGNYLEVRLDGDAPNTQAIGSRVKTTIGTTTQMREIRAGSNYASQNPALAHFGTGAASTIDELRVEWPTGPDTVMTNVPANQALVITQP